VVPLFFENGFLLRWGVLKQLAVKNQPDGQTLACRSELARENLKQIRGRLFLNPKYHIFGLSFDEGPPSLAAGGFTLTGFFYVVSSILIGIKFIGLLIGNLFHG